MAEFARSLERSLLTHARVSVDIEKGDSALRIGGVAKQLTAIITEAIDGEYGKILESENTKQLFGYGRTEQLDVPFQDFLKHNVKIFLNDSESDSEALRQLSVLSTGVACLQLFIQTNWTGPPHSYDPTQQIPLHYQQQGNDFQEYIFNSLCCDEGSIYSLVGKPLYLLIAQTLLIDCRKLLPSCQTVDWWALRCLFVKQRLLDERSPTCHDEIMHLIQQVQTSDLLSSSVQSFTKIQFHLELCYIYGYYYEYQKAKGELTNATKAAELEVTLAGALGKRTKFQHNDIAQLCLQVIKPESKAPIEDSIKLDVDRLPKDLLLNDETLLNKVQYADPEHNKIPNLSGLEQALLLAMCIEHKRVQPKQELLVEELQSYIQVILEQPRVWCIQTVALMMRSLLEDNRRKTVERSMMQLEVLVNQFNNNIPEGPDRLYLFYASNMPARWKIEQNFAKLLISLGAISTALEVYLRLHLWEEAIECYQALGRYEKAENLIREQLQVKETAKLWCILGDVTKDKECYDKAWEFSKHRSARAQRSLGNYYYFKDDFDTAIKHFQVSLTCNALQYDVWFRMGYAAMQAERYDIVVKAYYRCVILDNENFEAWNNLSTAYIKTDQKMKAYRTLQEALRCNYESWKVWENFLWTCTDVGQFEDTIRAYHRLLDLKSHYVDAEVLQILADAVVKGTTDTEGRSASRLKRKALELFGKQTSQVTNNSDVWMAYATLLGRCQSDNETDNDKALQCLQKAHRVRTQAGHWFNEFKSCKETLQESIQLAQAYISCSSKKTNSGESVQLLSSAKLMLKPVLSKVKQTHEDVVSGDIHPDLAETYKAAEQQLQAIVELIQQQK